MTDEKFNPDMEGLINHGSLLAKTEIDALRAEVARLEKMLGALADVSHRRRLEVQLERLKSRLEKTEQIKAQQTETELDRYRAISQALAEHMPVAMVVVEAPSGKILHTNKQLELLIKGPLLQTDNMQQYDQYGGFHPDGRPYAAKEYPVARAITEGQAVTVEDMYYRCADGQVRRLFVRATPVWNARGQMVAGVGMFFDITDE